jgi:pyridoxal 5'-phosphate synthase pdxT subunit
MRIGILALQGAFAEHAAMLARINAEAVEVRLPGQIAGIDGLILPGGESTTILKLMAAYGLDQAIMNAAWKGLPVMGTCAGLILLARKSDHLEKPPLGLLNIEVRRNAFGRQVDSFETDLPVPAFGARPFHAVFIRAPLITTLNPGVEVLCQLPGGEVVGVRQGRVLGLAFHPELGNDPRFHEYFLKLVTGAALAANHHR